MSDPQPGGNRPVSQSLPPRGGRPLFWLFATLLVAGLAYGGWRGYQWTLGALHAVSSQGEMLERLSAELKTMQTQAQDLSGRQTQLSAAVQRTGTDLASINSRVETNEQATSRLSETIEGGRTRVQLAAVEQLLLMANDRLLLAHDSASALKALDLADQRLALLSDPKLFKVREALAQERSALTALNLPDYTGLTLTLSELQKRAGTLPLRVHVPDRFTAPDVPAAPAPDAGFFGRIWASVRMALSRLFALRRNDGPPPRLLAPDEQALVAQVLQLRLEGARLALLAGDARTFQDLAGKAADWIHQYYDENDLDVKAELAELQRLTDLHLAPTLPDISHSLALLRQALGAR